MVFIKQTRNIIGITINTQSKNGKKKSYSPIKKGILSDVEYNKLFPLV